MVEKYIVEVTEDETHWMDFVTNKLHRLGGPAIEFASGSKHWYQNGKLHRLDGPAIEFADGGKAWFQNGEAHRLDGPAAEYSDGYKAWYQNGKRHRIDGPAVEHADGRKAWYIEGMCYTEEEFKCRIHPVKELTVAEIEAIVGHRIKIVKG